MRSYTRVVENYGPRQPRIGHIGWNPDKAGYELTWKGACLMAGRRWWPTSIVRSLAPAG